MVLVRGKAMQRLLFMGVVCLSLSMGLGTLVMAQESRSRKPASGWAKKDKKSVDLDAAIQEKLQKVLANQQLILQKAEAVKGELGIIKVRVTASGRTLVLPSGAACP